MIALNLSRRFCTETGTELAGSHLGAPSRRVSPEEDGMGHLTTESSAGAVGPQLDMSTDLTAHIAALRRELEVGLGHACYVCICTSACARLRRVLRTLCGACHRLSMSSA